MTPKLLAAPAELTLPAVPGLLEQLLATSGPVQLDLTATTEFDIAGLQLLIAASQDRRITLAPLSSPSLAAACRAAGVDPTLFSPGDSHV